MFTMLQLVSLYGSSLTPTKQECREIYVILPWPLQQLLLPPQPHKLLTGVLVLDSHWLLTNCENDHRQNPPDCVRW